MGSGSGKVKKFDKSVQIPAVTESKFPAKQPSPSGSFPSRSQQDEFDLNSNIEQYSSIWDHNTKLSSTFQRSSQSGPTKVEHHQKEMINSKWGKKSSTTVDSARVDSIYDTQTHSCINLSSSDKVDELINNLNRIHTELDEIIKRRTEQISIETESILSHIINETQQKQQRLLNFAKERQMKQDEQYHEFLQAYISQLDEKKAKELSQLQNQLQMYREQIMEESQSKIRTVNEQANSIKGKILQQEQNQATNKIDSIITQIQKMSTDEKFQQLGSESVTKTNVITNSNVGNKAAGQDCQFNFEHDNSTENSDHDQRARQHVRRTTVIEKKEDRRKISEEK